MIFRNQAVIGDGNEMLALFLVMIMLSIFDIRQMKAKRQIKETVLYILFMLMVGLFGIFYFSNPERDSFVKSLLLFFNRVR